MHDLIKWLFDGMLGTFIVSYFILRLTRKSNSNKNIAKNIYKTHFHRAYKYKKFSLDPYSVYWKPSYTFSITMPTSLDRDIICDNLNKFGFAKIQWTACEVDFRATKKLEEKLRNKFYRCCTINKYYCILLKFKLNILYFISLITAITYELFI